MCVAVSSLGTRNLGRCPATVKSLAGLTQLHTLKLQGEFKGDLQVTMANALHSLPMLEVLVLGGYRMRGVAVLYDAALLGEALQYLTNLRELSFAQLELAAAERLFVHLDKLPALRSLVLRGTRMGDAGARALAASAVTPLLKRLDLSACQLTSAGVAVLRPLFRRVRQLHTLNLSGRSTSGVLAVW